MNSRSALRIVCSTLLLLCCSTVHAAQYTIPLFVAPVLGGDPQGLLRLVNDSQATATVSIHAIGDAGNRMGPVSLTLNAAGAVELSASDLESGNAAKGLVRGLGALGGNVRLVIDSDVDINPSAYVREVGGALAAMNASVLESASARWSEDEEREGVRYDVTLFLGAGNMAPESQLRLINPGDAEARVRITARDDTGAPAPGGAVQLSLPAGGAQTLSAQQLESGYGASLTGWLGSGVGNWRLSVTSNRRIDVVNLTLGAAGVWRNLSTTAVDGWAPEDAGAFEARFQGQALVARSGNGDRNELHLLAGNRFRTTVITDGLEESDVGDYQYLRTGPETARMQFNYDSGAEGCLHLQFSAAREGWYSAACTDVTDPAEYLASGAWVALNSDATWLELGLGLDNLFMAVGSPPHQLPYTLPEVVSGGGGELSYSLSPRLPGLVFDPLTRQLSGIPLKAGTFLMKYQVRDSSGDADWRYFHIIVNNPINSRTATFDVGDTLTDIPAGDWRPDSISFGMSYTGENGSVVELGSSGYIAFGDYRYTCESIFGCRFENAQVTHGRIAQILIPSLEIDKVERFEMSDDIAIAEDIVYSNGRFHVLDRGRGKVFAYTDSGMRVPEADFDLADSHWQPRGIAYANGRFYVIDSGRYKVFAYTATGTRDPNADFDWDHRNGLPWGIAYAEGRLYVVPLGRDKVYAYSTDGARDPDADFNLAPDNDFPDGVSQADGRLYITDLYDDKGYAYTTSGERVPDAEFELAGRNSVVEGIAWGNDRFHVVDWLDDKVYAYTDSGARDPAADFDLADEPRDSVGIAHANGRLYVTDRLSDPKVLAYYPSGTRDPAADFDLAPNNNWPWGIAYAEGGFHVVQPSRERKVYAYTASGEPDPAKDFDLAPESDSPRGIAYANRGFRVVDWVDDKVYAYTSSGTRDLAADFDLDMDNSYASGITYVNARFHVVDSSGDKVYAYTSSGTRDPAADFDLAPDNNFANSITYANGWFYVVDGIFDHVFAYRVSGQSASETRTTRDGDCHVSLLVNPGESCTYPGTSETFWVTANGRGRFDLFSSSNTINIDNINIGGHVYDFSASHQGDGVWRVDRVGAGSPGSSPSFAGTQVPGNLTYPVGAPITAFTLPAAAGGAGILTYSLAPSVPGLTFNPARRRVSGTPASTGSYDMTYTAADTEGGSDSLNFSIMVVDDHGDDAASATGVAVESDTSGVLGDGDADWFQVDVDGPGWLEVYTSGNVDTTGRLEDAAGALIGSGDDAGADINFRISATVSAGTYYVEVRSFAPGDSGSFTLHVRFSASRSAATSEPIRGGG